MARQRQLMKELIDSAARLTAADQAYQEGDILVASRISITVARERPPTPLSRRAKQRLESLVNEAHTKLNEIDTRLRETAAEYSDSELLGMNGPTPGRWKETVTSAFGEYDELCQRYAAVPRTGRKLKAHVAGQRKRPEHAAVLNEPQAAALCDVARQHEQQQQACCAYWAYHEAAQLIPAPSARRAAEQVARMTADPQLMEAALACRQLQECHRWYQRAESVMPTWPERAEELLAQIIDTAPADSEIHRAARERIQAIRDRAH